MDEIQSSFRPYRDGRMLEIIDRKAYNASVNGIFVSRRGSPSSNYTTPPSLPPSLNTRKAISSSSSSSSSTAVTASSSSLKSWWNNPEMKRKKRVAKYKLYAVEGKVKASIKKGFRWIKRKCTNIVGGL